MTQEEIKKTGKIICAECGAELGHLEVLYGIIQGLCDRCKKALLEGRPRSGIGPRSPGQDETPHNEEQPHNHQNRISELSREASYE